MRKTSNKRAKRNSTKSIAGNPTVSRFAEVVESYCRLVEKGTSSRKRLLTACISILPELFYYAMQLPKGRASARITNELLYHDKLDGLYDKLPLPPGIVICRPTTLRYKSTRVSTARFFAVSERLSKILKDLNQYREVCDPYESSNPIEATLANDLAEIWHDVKPALLLYQMDDETAKRHAVYRWAIDVKIHWGPSHFASGLKVLFRALGCDNPGWR